MKTNSNNEFFERFDKESINFLINEKLKKRYNNLLNKNSDKKIFDIGRNFSKVAAMVFFVFGAFLISYYFIKESPEQMAYGFIKQTQVLGNQEIMRKNADKVELIRMEANLAFMSSQYDEAIDKYEKLDKLQKLSNMERFYFAIAYLKDSPPMADKALIHLEKIEKNSAMAQEVDWFKALALVMENKRTEAIKILDTIMTNQKFKADEAKQLLNKINKA